MSEEEIIQPNEFEADEAVLAKFRAEVAEMVHQEDMHHRGHESADPTTHLYTIEKDGSVRFVQPEHLTLVDAKMWERFCSKLG